MIEGIKPKQVSQERKGLQTSLHSPPLSSKSPTCSMQIDALNMDKDGSMIKKPMNTVKMMVNTFIKTKVTIFAKSPLSEGEYFHIGDKS